MQFVNRHRGMKRIAVAARRHPGLIIPFVSQIPDLGSGMRRSLRMKRERIGLIDLVSVVARYHMVFVCIALSNAGNKSLPDSRLAPRMDLMAGLVPVVEGSHHIDLLRVRRPHGEVRARGAVNGARMSPEVLV